MFKRYLLRKQILNSYHLSDLLLLLFDSITRFNNGKIYESNIKRDEYTTICYFIA